MSAFQVADGETEFQGEQVPVQGQEPSNQDESQHSIRGAGVVTGQEVPVVPVSRYWPCALGLATLPCKLHALIC